MTFPREGKFTSSHFFASKGVSEGGGGVRHAPGQLEASSAALC